MKQKKKLAIILICVLAVILVGAAVASKIIASNPYHLPTVKYRPTETPAVEETEVPETEPTDVPEVEPTETIETPVEVPETEPADVPEVEPTEVIETPAEVPETEPTDVPEVEPTEVVEAPAEVPEVEVIETPAEVPAAEATDAPTAAPAAEEPKEPEHVSEPTAAPTEQPEVITEADLPEEAQKIGTIEDALDPSRYIDIYAVWQDDVLSFGTQAQLIAVLHGYDAVQYTLQWQISTDNANWTDIPDATGARCDVTVTEDNYLCWWRVQVLISDVR
jgi:hypothetical protein